jgi:CHAT domain-containing protein
MPKILFFCLVLLLCYESKSFSQDKILALDSLEAKSYLTMADSLEKLSEYENAAQCYNNAADYYYLTENWNQYASCKMNELYVLIDASKFDEAMGNITQAISLINSKLPENNIFSFHCQVKKSLLFYKQEKYTEAIDILKNSIDLFKQHSESDSTNGQKVLASAYFEYGNNFLSIGKRDSAIYMYEKTLAIRQKTYKKNDELIVDCFNNLGIVYAYFGDFKLANTYMLKALNAREELHGFAHPQTAWSFTNLAILNIYSGDYEKALEYAHKGLESRKQCLSSEHVELASSYSTIANIYNETGDFDKSLEYNTLALGVYKKIFGENSTQVASIYNNMADNYNKHKMYFEALKYFKKAYQIHIAEAGSNLTPQKVMYEMNIADTYFNLNNIDSANYYNRSAYLSNFTPLVKNHSIEALIDLESAFIILEQKAQIHIRKYQLSKEINNLKIAYKSYLDYIELMDYFKQKTFEEDSKIDIIRRNNSIMNDAIDLVYTLHKELPDEYSSEQVSRLIEKNKSNTLLEMMERTYNVSEKLPDSVAIAWKQLSAAIYELKTERDYILSTKSDTNISALSDSLFVLQSKFHRLNEHIEKNYENVTGNFQLNSFNNKKALKNEYNTALLNYYISDSLMYICFTDNSREIIRTTTIDSLFQDKVKQYLSYIRKNRFAGVRTLAPQLYNILIQPVSDLIENKEKLIIIPDKFLYYLPFESLTHDIAINNFKDKKYLINDYEIVYQYSKTMYCRYLSKQKTKISSNCNWLGYAPVFNDNGEPLAINNESLTKTLSETGEDSGELRRSISIDGKTFNSLPYSEKEVQEIAAIFKSQNFSTSEYFFSEASKNSFLENCSDYKILHLASHGIINESSPKLSGILFYPESDTSGSSGKLNSVLTAGEIYNLEIQADLVVLSACETGIGSIIQGEGVISLTRALTYSGASNIIYTLWKVGDKNSYAIMLKFYEYLLNGETYSGALRKAKLDMIKNEETAFPGSWSAFSLIAI